jgi:hypothetical protein
VLDRVVHWIASGNEKDRGGALRWPPRPAEHRRARIWLNHFVWNEAVNEIDCQRVLKAQWEHITPSSTHDEIAALEEAIVVQYRLMDAFARNTPTNIPADVAHAFEAYLLANDMAGAYTYAKTVTL